MRTLIQVLCTVLGLLCVAGLSGVVAGHMWNRYADQNGLLRVSEIYERILPARGELRRCCSEISGCYHLAGTPDSGNLSKRRVISLQRSLAAASRNSCCG